MVATPANSLNITTAGIVKFDGTATFSAITVTQHDVLVGAASNGITSVAPSATSGVPLVSGGASADPSFTTAVVAGGGTGQVTLTNHGVLVGAATSAITQLAAGSAGQVLQSGGASADPAYSTPTYPSASGATGKILISDGTNNVYSTPTYPNASASSGKILISDGTNFIASTPTFPNSASGTGTILRADGTNWVATTATYPTTTTINQLLYSSSASVIAGLATANSGVLQTNSSGVPSVATSGTWTPVITFGGASTGITYTSQNSFYFQIGNLVFITFEIILSNKGSSTGSASITGLPISTGANGGAMAMAVVSSNAITLTALYTGITLFFKNSSTTADLIQYGSAQTTAALANTAFANTSKLYGNGFYIIA